ncbi:4-(cytidine 5'-diphospho)-2-C-methyl-D-erythritol kinase [soil metagenome]
MPILRLDAHAKINIGLEVLGKRPDGFHEIRSVFVPITLADVVSTEDSPVDSVTCVPAVTDKPENNLAYRAMQAIRSRSNAFDRTAKITVVKHIPTGGGLGGGSSDAAAVLRLLNEQWKLSLTQSDLCVLAAELGSDVPFFVDEQISFVEGRGEQISKLDVKIPYHIVIVVPGIHISTPEAYAALGRGPLTPRDTAPSGRDQFLASVLPYFTSEPMHSPPDVAPVNDFEPAIFLLHPELPRIKQQLYDAGAIYAAMSGSGSTMYGLFATEEGGKAALEAFRHLTAYLCQPL